MFILILDVYFNALHIVAPPTQPPFTTQRLPLPWRHLGHRIPLPYSNTLEYGWTLRGPSALSIHEMYEISAS